MYTSIVYIYVIFYMYQYIYIYICVYVYVCVYIHVYRMYFFPSFPFGSTAPQH